MQTDDHPIHTIFSENRRFMVPLYQRKYQWGDKRLLPFWTNVEAKAAEVLEGQDRFQHYMGALILAPLGDGVQFGITPRVQVVDGQQRLTTFQLFLASLREVAREHSSISIIEQVQGFLFNNLRPKDTDPNARFKLMPTPSDQAIFHYMMDETYSDVRSKYNQYYWGGRVPKNTAFPALRTYQFFIETIRNFVLIGPEDTDPEIEEDTNSTLSEKPSADLISSRLEALLTAVLSRMKLVVITLGEGDDAQVIFETLNSQGQPLLAMDLVRNNIFHRAEQQTPKTEALYKDFWDPFDAPWWREDAPNARPRRPRIDHFLAHVLSAETGANVSMSELYAEYRNFAVPKGRPRFAAVEDELKVLQRHAPTYRTLEGQNDTGSAMQWLGQKLSAWQVTTAYPVAFQLAASSMSSEDRWEAAKIIYSYIVRRAVCGLTNKNLNKLFQGLTQRFLKEAPSLSVLKDYLRSRSGDSSRFPDDQEFTRGLINNRLYGLIPSDRLKEVLWEMELALRSKFSEAPGTSAGLWIEHIMPQSWTDEWPLPDGSVLKRDYSDERDRDRSLLIQTLGNLTLVSSGLNISVGNSSFAMKKQKFAEHTGLFLNKSFSQLDRWTEEEIHARSVDLATRAITIWDGLSAA